jgi:hypothetical protein
MIIEDRVYEIVFELIGYDGDRYFILIEDYLSYQHYDLFPQLELLVNSIVTDFDYQKYYI